MTNARGVGSIRYRQMMSRKVHKKTEHSLLWTSFSTADDYGNGIGARRGVPWQDQGFMISMILLKQYGLLFIAVVAIEQPRLVSELTDIFFLEY